MSSKIGDYIHLHYSNYRRYGLAKKTKGGRNGSAQPLELTSLLSQAKTEVFSTLKGASASKNLQSMQKLANELMGNNSSNGVNSILNSKDLEELRTGIVQYINKGLGALTVDDIDWETLSVKPSSYEKVKNTKFQGEYARKLTTLRGNTRFKTSKQFKPSTFQSYVKDLQTVYGEVANSLKKGEQTRILEELKALDKIAKSYEGEKLIPSGENTQGAVNRQRLFNLARDLIKLSSIAVIEGDLLETVIAAVGSQLADTGNKSIEKILEEFVTGTLSGQLSYSSANYAKGVDMKKVLEPQMTKGTMEKQKTSDGALEYYIKRTTQGKIDVKFSIKEEAYKFTAKNYNLSETSKYNNISLVTGTRLLTALQSEGLFLNHYLNQSVISKTQSGLDVGPNNLIRKRANQALREMMILKAIVGGNLYRNGGVVGEKANVFVINDKSQKGGIRFVTIEELLSKITRQTNALENKFNISPELQTWSNIWQKTKENRITNVIAQINKYKYNVSFKKSAIKTALY